MKKALKRVVVFGLAMTLAAAALVGCGKSEKKADSNTNTGTVDSSKPDTWIADRTIVVQAYVDDIGYTLPEDINSTPVMKELTKRTGIKLDIRYTPGDSDEAVLASQLASGTIPDVIVTYLNNSTRPEFSILLKAAQEGMFADVAPFMKNSKVYKNYLEDGYLPNDAKENITFREEFNGAAYIMQLYIPKVDRSTQYMPEDEYVGGLYIQKAIADDLGINPREIKTQEQFYNLLVAIKNGGYTDENGNPVYPVGPKYWGGSPDALEYITKNYDWGVSDGYNITKDGQILHEAETDYVYDKINFVRKLLAEGLINPEFFTMDSTRAEEVSKTKNSAIIADVHNYEEIIYGSEDWIPLGPLSDFTGSNAEIVHGKNGYGAWAISADAENPEEIFKFFDYLSTYEGQLLAEYGIEGEHYEMVDGFPVIKEEVLERLNAGDADYLVNEIGAAFGGAGNVFFDFVLTNTDFIIDFGESRPGAGSSETYGRSIQIAKDYPVEKKLVPGLDATAYLSDPSLTEVKAQMSLLNYDEMLVQAIYASSDAEVKNIVESFRAQLKSAGIDQFREHLKTIYSENSEAITFYAE